MPAHPEHLLGICASSHQPHYYSASFALDYQLVRFCLGFVFCLSALCSVILFRAKPQTPGEVLVNSSVLEAV